MLKDVITVSLELCWHKGQEGKVSVRDNKLCAWPPWCRGSSNRQYGGLGSYERWNLKKKKENHFWSHRENDFSFLPWVFWVFSHCLASLTTQPQVSQLSSCPWSTEWMLVVFPLSFPYLSQNQSSQWILPLPIVTSFQVWEVDLGCFWVTFPYHLPACLPAAALLAKMLFALKASWQWLSKAAA